MEYATITNIQRYSLHDGPGLRTIIFLKGCPLSCRWCSNPETQGYKPELLYSPAQCIACGSCIEACEYGAFTGKNDKISLDKTICINCGECAEVCPTGAASMVGREISVLEAADTLEADAVFFRRSGGGVTISGGEPSQHPAFTNDLILELKRRGIHSAVETCGYAPWESFRETIQNSDLVLFDLKIADPEKHKKGTGTDNELIFSNAERISTQLNIIFRIPVIPGYTTERSNLEEIADFIVSLGRKKENNDIPELHLLPYHSFGSAKYRSIGKLYELNETLPPSDEEMDIYRRIFTDRSIEVKIV